MDVVLNARANFKKKPPSVVEQLVPHEVLNCMSAMHVSETSQLFISLVPNFANLLSNADAGDAGGGCQRKILREGAGRV